MNTTKIRKGLENFWHDICYLAALFYICDMALKQELSQKFLQKLSPQQIQFIKLLQLNTQDFEEKVSQELLDNPALENMEGADDNMDYRATEDRNAELRQEKNDETKETYDTDDLNVNSDFDEYSHDINVDELLRAGGDEVRPNAIVTGKQIGRAHV